MTVRVVPPLSRSALRWGHVGLWYCFRRRALLQPHEVRVGHPSCTLRYTAFRSGTPRATLCTFCGFEQTYVVVRAQQGKQFFCASPLYPPTLFCIALFGHALYFQWVTLRAAVVHPSLCSGTPPAALGHAHWTDCTCSTVLRYATPCRVSRADGVGQCPFLLSWFICMLCVPSCIRTRGAR